MSSLFSLRLPRNTRSRAPPKNDQPAGHVQSVTCVLYNDPVVPLYGSSVRVGAMAKEDNHTSGVKSFFSNYRSQIIILGVIGIAIVAIAQIFPAFWRDHWIPISVNAAAFGFLTLLSFWKRFWRDYRWLAGSGILILLVLIDFSWGKSILGLNALERRQSVEYVFSQSGAVLQVEYPEKILYDGENTGSLVLLLTTNAPCQPASITIASSDLFFAIPTSNDTPPQWTKTLTVPLQKDGKAITILIRPAQPASDFTKEAFITVQIPHTELTLRSAMPPVIKLESRQDAQRRLWGENLMDTGGIIVSLIIAVFAGIKQLESERKSQRISEIKQAIDDFNTGIINDISKTMHKHHELVGDWNDWDKTLRDQFRDKYASFIEKDLWEAIANKTLEEVKEDVQRLLQICERIFEDKASKPTSTIKLLYNAFQGDARALLSMLKEYPESIGVAKQIARNLPDDLKNEIPEKYKDEFQQEIILLKEELGFPDTESFPLQSRFRFYAVSSHAETRFAAWLEKHGLRCSPFADADSPNTSIPLDEKLLIEHVPAGFSLPAFEHTTQNFAFANSWDAGAALFEYARNLPQKIKKETFVAALTHSLIANFGVEQPRHLFLHALAEGWMWTLADAPAIYYSLGKSQRTLAGRLLRWHGGSPSAIVSSLEQILDSRKEEKGIQKFIEHVAAWLENIEANDLRKEEIPALIELRPSSKQQFTRALVSSVNWQISASAKVPPTVYDALERESEWLKSHGWALVCFMISDSNPQMISEDNLTKQCQQRVQICSNGEVEALESLFAPHPEEPADLLLARKAAGSPGKMVRLGQELLRQHVKKYSPDKPLHIEDLLALA
jgi:hypothetical protein